MDLLLSSLILLFLFICMISNGCIIAGLLYSATAAVFVGSGFLAWEWTEPNSFWSAVGFLIVWGILTKIGHFIVSLIVMGIASIFD